MKENNHLDNIIEKCKAIIEERKKMYKEIKAIYNPQKDKQGSSTWSFMHWNMELRKINMHDIKTYQEKYNVQLPKLIIRVVTEIGSGRYVNSNLVNREFKLSPPRILIEKEFLDLCIAAKINPDEIESGIGDFYQFENNTFAHPQVQEIYTSVNSDRDKYLVVIYDIGHDAIVILNREDNGKVAVAEVPGITNIPFDVDEIERDSPYYHYTGGTLEQFICPVNNDWWKKMKRDIIAQKS